MKRLEINNFYNRIDGITDELIKLESNNNSNPLVPIKQFFEGNFIVFVFENNFYGRNPIVETYKIPMNIIVSDDWNILLKKYLDSENIELLEKIIKSDDYKEYDKTAKNLKCYENR